MHARGVVAEVRLTRVAVNHLTPYKEDTLGISGHGMVRAIQWLFARVGMHEQEPYPVSAKLNGVGATPVRVGQK